MAAIIFYLILPFIFCNNDYQLIRVWMKDFSSMIVHGVTHDSLFLTVDIDIPKLMSPDFKYSISDVLEKQTPHKYLKNDDDFMIYGNHHWNQQVFRFLPDVGHILSERFPNMALSVVNDYLQLVEKKSVAFNWKWKIKESKFASLYELRHSHFELEHFLIEYFNTNSNITNSTHITVDDIQPEFINSITRTTDKTEDNFTKIKQKQHNIKTQTIIEKRKTEQSKKKNTTIWIFISVIVILIIIGIFTKIGCFPRYTTRLSNGRSNLEEMPGGNLNS